MDFDLAELFTPRTLHAHVLDCLAQVETVGWPEEMMSQIAWDLVRAPVRYLDPFTPEELVPLLQADRTRTRRFAFQLLGRVKQAARRDYNQGAAPLPLTGKGG